MHNFVTIIYDFQVIFYTVMFLENSLLIGVWAVGVNGSDLQSLQNHPRPIVLVLSLLALFFGGLFFMGLYYRFFHVRRLRYEAGGRMNGINVVTTLSNQAKIFFSKLFTSQCICEQIKYSDVFRNRTQSRRSKSTTEMRRKLTVVMEIAK